MKSIAIVGATGNVGRKVIDILEENTYFNNYKLIPIASAQSSHKKVDIRGIHTRILDIDSLHWDDYEIVIFATKSSVSQKYIPVVKKHQCSIIDCSSYFRMHPQVPLVIPPVNLHSIQDSHQLVSTANCIASPTCTALAPIHAIFPIKRIVISTYQSVSGAGKEAMEELTSQTKSFFSTIPYQRTVFEKDIAFNVIPMIDDVLPNGITGEESKIALEIKKVIGSEVGIAVQSVRVPVFVGHSSSVFIEFEDEISLDAIKESLRLSPHIILMESYQNCITPSEVSGENMVFISRIRKDPSLENGIIMWITSDNLRRGAALDAVEVAEHILRTRTV